MSSTLGAPIINTLNNGTSSVVKGMPLKDQTSDNNASFSMGRRKYGRGLVLNKTENEKQVKKWFGSRDSSDVMEKRKLKAIGNGSLNADSNTLSFTNTRDTNTARQALAKVRNSGSIAPKKVTHSTQIFK